jgi:peptidoglycan hydrolase CwlO-like protein
VLKLEAHLKKKQDEIRQLENEKDNLQFKRDENTKSLEHKLKEVKSRVKDLEAENDCLQGELEKLKNGEML